MKQSQHTPGPWEVDCRTGCFAVRRRGDKLNCLSEASRDSIVFQNGRSEELSEPNGYRYLTDEQIANARLIAAAPAMYELLKDILDELRKAIKDAIETGNREGSSLPDRLELRIYEIIKEVEG